MQYRDMVPCGETRLKKNNAEKSAPILFHIFDYVQSY